MKMRCQTPSQNTASTARLPDSEHYREAAVDQPVKPVWRRPARSGEPGLVVHQERPAPACELATQGPCQRRVEGLEPPARIHPQTIREVADHEAWRRRAGDRCRDIRSLEAEIGEHTRATRFRRAFRGPPHSHPLPTIDAGVSGRTRDRNRSRRPLQSSRSARGQRSAANVLPSPGATTRAISAPSMISVPEPQTGSRSGWSGLYPASASKPAASVSRSGAREVSCRQPRRWRSSPPTSADREALPSTTLSSSRGVSPPGPLLGPAPPGVATAGSGSPRAHEGRVLRAPGWTSRGRAPRPARPPRRAAPS